jgi:hypothetical protein
MSIGSPAGFVSLPSCSWRVTRASSVRWHRCWPQDAMSDLPVAWLQVVRELSTRVPPGLGLTTTQRFGLGSWRVATHREHRLPTTVHVSCETVAAKGIGVVHPVGEDPRIDVLGRPASATASLPRSTSRPRCPASIWSGPLEAIGERGCVVHRSSPDRRRQCLALGHAAAGGARRRRYAGAGSFLSACAIAWFHVEHRSAVELGPLVATLSPETSIHPTLGPCGWLERGPRVGSQ